MIEKTFKFNRNWLIGLSVSMLVLMVPLIVWGFMSGTLFTWIPAIILLSPLGTYLIYLIWRFFPQSLVAIFLILGLSLSVGMIIATTWR